MPTPKKTLTRYDFESLNEYLLYPFTSYENGQLKQAKEYYSLLVKRGYREQMLEAITNLYGHKVALDFSFRMKRS